MLTNFQIREARMIEQSHNPNYLKSSKKSKHHQSDRKPIEDGCEDIPIAELALDVPLQIICMLLDVRFVMCMIF